MKTLICLCVIASLVVTTANAQGNAPPISAADLAIQALLERNKGKECVSTAEIMWLKWMIDADSEYDSRVKCPPGMNDFVMRTTSLCPCPGGGCCCSCDTMMVRSSSVASLKKWDVAPWTLKSKTGALYKAQAQASGPEVVLHKIDPKTPDGDYIFTISGKFGGKDAVTLELPTTIQQGRFNFGKRK